MRARRAKATAAFALAAPAAQSARCRARARTRRPRGGTPAPGRRPRPCRRAPAQRGAGSAASTSIAARTESGIGVVAVVDQRDLDAGACEAPASASGRCTGAERLEPAHDRHRAGAGSERAARRGERVVHVVRAGDAQARTSRRRPASASSPAEWSPCHAASRGHVGGARRARSRRVRAFAGDLAPDRRAARRRPGTPPRPSAPSASIAAPFSRATASTLAMNSWCSRCALLTSAIVGAAICASSAISPGWFMPSSTTAARCSRSRRRSKRQRHADVVVEVALGRERRVAEPGAQDRRDHLRHRRLAVAAGDRDERQLEAARARRRRIAERAPACRRPASPASRPRRARARPARRPRRAPWHRRGTSWASKRSPRSATNRSPGATLRVSLWTRANACRASPTSCASGSMRAASPSVIMRCHRGARTAAARRSAAARGAHPRTGPGAGDLLVVLVALAGDRGRDRAGAALPTAWRIASARFSITSISSAADRAGGDLRQDQVGRLERGLSLVRTTRPASRQAIAPISGRLAASRLPPQPNTHQSLPPRARASGRARRAPSRARRACARSRRRPRAARRRPRLRRPTRCMRPGTGVSAGRRSAASASGTPSARNTPMTHEQVARVVVADQRRRDRDALLAFDDVERQAVAVVTQTRGAQRARARRASRSSSRSSCRRRRARLAELEPLRVVEVDHRRAQARPGEQLRLGLPVGAHVAVVVEMVLA